MGQQQLLLLVLGIILLAVSVSVGLAIYKSNADSANKDQIYNQLNFAASAGYAHYMKAKTFSGAERNIDDLLKQESINIWMPKLEQISGEPVIQKTANGFSISVISSNGRHKAIIEENVNDNSRKISWNEIK